MGTSGWPPRRRRLPHSCPIYRISIVIIHPSDRGPIRPSNVAVARSVGVKATEKEIGEGGRLGPVPNGRTPILRSLLLHLGVTDIRRLSSPRPRPPV